MVTVLGGLAGFERELIRARTSEGRARAVERGVKLGRRPRLTRHQEIEARRRRDTGDESLAEDWPQLQCRRLDDWEVAGSIITTKEEP